jgi:hypothetical protein
MRVYGGAAQLSEGLRKKFDGKEKPVPGTTVLASEIASETSL